MSADDRVQRIAEATGYRHNHIRRILKTINPPDHVKAQMVVDLFKIPQDKASLIVPYGPRGCRAAGRHAKRLLAHPPISVAADRGNWDWGSEPKRDDQSLRDSA